MFIIYIAVAFIFGLGLFGLGYLLAGAQSDSSVALLSLVGNKAQSAKLDFEQFDTLEFPIIVLDDAGSLVFSNRMAMSLNLSEAKLVSDGFTTYLPQIFDLSLGEDNLEICFFMSQESSLMTELDKFKTAIRITDDAGMIMEENVAAQNLFDDISIAIGDDNWGNTKQLGLIHRQIQDFFDSEEIKETTMMLDFGPKFYLVTFTPLSQNRIITEWKEITDQFLKEKLIPILDQEIVDMNRCAGEFVRISKDVSIIANSTSSQVETVSHLSHTIREQQQALNDEISLSFNQITQIQEETMQTHQLAIKAEGEIHKMMDVVKSLAKEAESLQTETDSIKEVAKRTQILALNASIQAQHAGQFGKGFGVISNEINNLSQSSQKISEEINLRIQNVIFKNQKNVEQMKSVAAAIKQILSTLTNSTDNFKKQSALMQEVSDIGEQISNSDTQISSEMKLLLDQNARVLSHIKEGEHETVQLSRMIKALVKYQGQWKITPNEVYRQIGIFNNIVTELLRSKPPEVQVELAKLKQLQFTNKVPREVLAKLIEILPTVYNLLDTPCVPLTVPKQAITPTQVFMLIAHHIDQLIRILKNKSMYKSHMIDHPVGIELEPSDVYSYVEWIGRKLEVAKQCQTS